MSQDFVVYQFTRSKVEAGDFSHFLSLYAPDRLPTGRRLREMMNTLTFIFDGYNADPRELHSIPEVRSFAAALHQAWPFWLYFGNLDSELFLTMYLCRLPTITAVRVEPRANVAVEYDRIELLQLLRSDLGWMNVMCDRGNMFESAVMGRTKAIFDYFQLPSDVTND